MGAEALSLHVEGLIDDGEPLPEPSTLDVVMRDRENRDGVAILVPVDVRFKSVRVNVTVPQDALRAIDAFAESHGYTRSGFLVSAARKIMEYEGPRPSASKAQSIPWWDISTASPSSTPSCPSCLRGAIFFLSERPAPRVGLD